MTAPKKSCINPDLEKAINKLLKEVMSPSSETNITDKVKVIDRALKLDALKLKLQDDAWGKGFYDDDDDDKEG